MKTDLITAILAIASAVNGAVMAARDASSTQQQQACPGQGDDRHCRPVQHITYHHVGGAGQYREVVGMDQQTGTCQFATRQISGGPLAPFDEPVSQVKSSQVKSSLAEERPFVRFLCTASSRSSSSSSSSSVLTHASSPNSLALPSHPRPGPAEAGGCVRARHAAVSWGQ